MALYALDGDRTVYAGEAQERKDYRCAGCHSKVQVRKGPFRIPHFYHQSKSPSCRLYSKSQDHLLAQLAIQALLPSGEAQIEKPLLDIHRIADVFWEPHKIAFEIQCSLLTPYETLKRVADYHKAGYKIVWILDDRLYNRRRLRPAEALIRTFTCYYATLRRQPNPIFYDQFEILSSQQRLYKGRRLKVRLNIPQIFSPPDWEEKELPNQILSKAIPGTLHFQGDLLHLAQLSPKIPALFFSMQNLRAQEILFAQNIKREESLMRRLVLKWILHPFGLLLLNLMEWAER